MPTDIPRKDHLFNIAAEIRDPKARAAYLDDACRDDEELRRDVEELLRHDQEDNSFLEVPAATILGHTASMAPETQIGPYKLLERIGEGGFGIVYMAEQEHPVRRKVALKIIKPGMDTAQVIARFEAERQALAIMEHPHIARVYDAGATASGRPYFVMELVKGVPITEFCDKNRMPAEQRLKLFVDVCHAVQHAHHKGVIHRDIKPSNVLVTLHDGQPVVKVIDFGIAKAMGRELTDRTLFTAFAQLVGTPLYMSPEQAEMSGLDIDTRSDIYSLGVLLYELLTGTTPLEAQRVRQAGYAEIQRLIRDEESPRPSTRLSSLGESATVLAGNRAADPKQLARLLAGEVDWIVMKALEKDRNRRYSTPGEFASDIERYLRRDLVLARPPSTAYRMKKFVQRHRVAVLTGSAISAALALGLVLATWGMFAARDAEQRALNSRDAEAIARQQADDARTAEEALRRKAEEQAIRLRVERSLLRGPYYHHTTMVLELCQILPDVPDHLPQWKEYLCLKILAEGQAHSPIVASPTHDGFAITSMVLSPDRRTLATRGLDGSLRLWDFLTLEPLTTVANAIPLTFSYDETRLAYLPDGRTIWTVIPASPERSAAAVLFWDTATGDLRRSPSFAEHPTFQLSENAMVVLTPKSFKTLSGGGISPYTLELYDTHTFRQLAELNFNDRCHVVFNREGRLMAAVGRRESQVHVVSTVDGERVKTLEFDSPVSTVGFTPSGKFLVTVDDQQIVWWNTDDWQAADRALPQFSQAEFGYAAQFPGEDIVTLSIGSYVRGREGVLPFTIVQVHDNLALSPTGGVYDLETLERIQQPDRRYPAEAALFAVHGRFLHLDRLIDLATELPVSPAARPIEHLRIDSQDIGWYMPDFGGYGWGEEAFVVHHCLFLPDDLTAMDPQAIALWAKLVLRGEIDQEGNLANWDEATWEAKRQELLQLARPIGEFPFPGQAAHDPWYWLRCLITNYTHHIHAEEAAPDALPLQDRLVTLEPTWPNYATRANLRRACGKFVLALEDDLEGARLAGPAYWSIEPVLSNGWERAWGAARATDLSPSHYELVLRWADARTTAQPDDRNAEVTALALYRLGRYADALNETGVADVDSPDFLVAPAPRFEEESDRRPNAPLIAALCTYRLGDEDLARRMLRRIQERPMEAQWWFDPDLLREAEQLIDPPAAGPPPRTDGSGADATTGSAQPLQSDLSMTSTFQSGRQP